MTPKNTHASRSPTGDGASHAGGRSTGPRPVENLIAPLEVELRNCQTRFRALIEHVSEGVFITDRAGTYVDANACALDLLGFSRQALLGRRLTETIAMPERSRVAAEVTQILGGQLNMSEWSFLRADGATFRGEVCARMMPDGFILATLRESEARTRTLAENLPVGVFMASPDGQNIFSNAVLQKQLGRTFGEMLGEVWAESASLHAEDRGKMAAAWKEFCTRRTPFELTARFVRADGEIRFIHSSVKAVQTEGRIVCYVGSTDDRTDRHESEAKISAERTALEAFRAALQNGLAVPLPLPQPAVAPLV